MTNQELVPIFSTLSTESRLKLWLVLLSSPSAMSSTELIAVLEIPSSSFYHDMDELISHNLASKERIGAAFFYSPVDQTLFDLQLELSVLFCNRNTILEKVS